MKILSAPQIRELDAYTIKHEPISSVKLMARAVSALYLYFEDAVGNAERVHIFCGMGNNGGDGMVLALRYLELVGENIYVWVVKHKDKASPDFNFYEAQVRKRLKINYIQNEKQIPKLKQGDVVIDAIFGSGLSRPVEGIAAKVIRAINRYRVPVYSIDMPSGLFCDAANQAGDEVVEADEVFTFHSPKLSFFFPQNAKYVPKFTVLDIGLSKKRSRELQSPFQVVERSTVAGILKPRDKFSHKGIYGHALIAAGSMGKVGAAILALRAAIRCGVGLVSGYVPGFAHPIIHGAIPEVMLAGVPQADAPVLMQEDGFDTMPYSAIGIGPGIGTDYLTGEFLESIFDTYKRPMVLDADALNIVAAHKKMLKKIPGHSILTPHPGEFKRLVGEWKDDLDKLKKQLAFAKAHKVIVVLKGAHTSIATPDGKIYFNNTGNPGMAKGGSGDVLTGVITGLLAQGYSSLEAGLLGVYVHGLAGDIARDEKGETAMNASDIIDCLPKAFKGLENKDK